jgi:hypothetical protein
MEAVTSRVSGLLEEVWRVLFGGGRLRSEGMGRGEVAVGEGTASLMMLGGGGVEEGVEEGAEEALRRVLRRTLRTGWMLRPSGLTMWAMQAWRC